MKGRRARTARRAFGTKPPRESPRPPPAPVLPHDAKRERRGFRFRGAPSGPFSTPGSLMLVRHAVLHAIVLLGALRVVEAVERAHQVARDAADALEGLAVLVLGAAALRAHVLDDAVVAADGVAVDRMVHRAVAHAAFLHVTDDRLERLEVVGRVAVKLDVGDVAAVGQRVIRRLDGDLVEGRDVVIHRHVEPVGVVVAIRNAGDHAVALAVDAHETARQPLGRRGDERVVHAALTRDAIAVRSACDRRSPGPGAGTRGFRRDACR